MRNKHLLITDVEQDKLERRQYPNLTALESDFKRMVQNAKDFNDKKSLIYEDAERVRKGASNWFTRHNPAYNDRNYVARPTPIPDEANGTPATPTPVTLKITTKAARTRTPAKSVTPAPPVKAVEKPAVAAADGLSDFTGKTFQQAQDQLVQELIDYQE